MADSPKQKTKHQIPLESDSVAQLKEQRLSFFSTFVELPKGVTYENQEADETILVLARRHPITNLPWSAVTLFLLILPLFVVPFLTPLFDNFPFLYDLPSSYVLILTMFYYSLVLGYGLLNFVSWFYNISLVTDNEVVDIDYSSVTFKDIATTNLREIQDVEYEQRGFLATFFNYGDVHIQTAGAHPNIEFLRVPKPGKINDIIMDEKRRIVGHE